MREADELVEVKVEVIFPTTEITESVTLPKRGGRSRIINPSGDPRCVLGDKSPKGNSVIFELPPRDQS